MGCDSPDVAHLRPTKTSFSFASRPSACRYDSVASRLPILAGGLVASTATKFSKIR
ncbi:hypothetical protein Pan14r_09630 [Crateriforma conspicua]|uniref:Uncharacterized protein n=1 Tax=Crateriforma conspicua TaxID=2527996 RepID=A0A5C5XZ60_9PLAN|nr:hypothetical protein Pan14r_09630 [Crateriforma conspicua]